MIRVSHYVNVTLTTDSESDIYVDNEYKGKGCWSGKLSSSKHLVEVKKDLYQSVQHVISLSNKDKNITIESPQLINAI